MWMESGRRRPELHLHQRDPSHTIDVQFPVHVGVGPAFPRRWLLLHEANPARDQVSSTDCRRSRTSPWSCSTSRRSHPHPVPRRTGPGATCALGLRDDAGRRMSPALPGPAHVGAWSKTRRLSVVWYAIFARRKWCDPQIELGTP